MKRDIGEFNYIYCIFLNSLKKLEEYSGRSNLYIIRPNIGFCFIVVRQLVSKKYKKSFFNQKITNIV
jgi:hypothetical protein